MRLQIKNLNIHYIDTGAADSGDCVLILHGWGTDCTTYNIITDHLKNNFRVLVPDLPGFGQSDSPNRAWSASDYADFVLEFLKELKIDRLVLLGHSHGGRIIIKMLSMDNPSITVPKIILTGSAGIKPKRSLKYYCKIYTYKTVKKLLAPFPKTRAKYAGKAGSADYKNASPVMKHTLSLCVNEDLTPVLHKIKAETLLIWGKDDTATPMRDAKIMEKEIKNSGLVILNGGHYSFLDDRYTYLKVLDSFLGV